MRILLSTTIGHNPGDELIAMGVMNLLREVIKEDIEVVYYNRNPDLQMRGPQRFPLASVGNYQTDPVDLSYIDAVVLAGSPEWFGAPMAPLYKALLDRPDVPLWMLGVGLGEKSLMLQDYERELFQRTSTVVIARSRETVSQFPFRDSHITSLVCPALFCASDFTVPWVEQPAYIVQKPGYGWHEIDPSYLVGLQDSKRLVTEHVKELQHFTEFSQGRKIEYAATGEALLKTLSKYQRVYSTRLHGAVGALSLGIRSVVIGDRDFRIRTAASMFQEYLPCVKNFEEAKTVHLTSSSSIFEFKEEQKNLWVKTMKAMSIGA